MVGWFGVAAEGQKPIESGFGFVCTTPENSMLFRKGKYKGCGLVKKAGVLIENAISAFSLQEESWKIN